MTGPDEQTVKTIGPIWRELWGGVWHTTHPERFLSILDDGEILPEPQIPDGDRWGTACGPELHPFVRSIGGVSLFDFRNFNPITYQENYPLSMWRTFAPYRSEWAGAVWLEVEHEKIEPAFISGPELVARWKKVNELGRKIMPHIEAAHIGNLALSNIRRAIFIRSRDDRRYHPFDINPFDRPRYEALLPEWREELEFARLPIHEQFKRRPPDFSNAPDNPDVAERMAEAEKRVEKHHSR